MTGVINDVSVGVGVASSSAVYKDESRTLCLVSWHSVQLTCDQ